MIFSHLSQRSSVRTHNTHFEQATNLLWVSGVEGLESSGTSNSFWQRRLYSIVGQAEWAGPGAHRKGLKQVWHQLSASQETIKPLVKGTAPGPLFYHTKMAFKCKFPLGPKGDLASALALLIWTNMWSVLICIMGRMEMRGQLCQPKTKRRKKKGRQTDAILLNCICTTQRCDILSLIWPLLIMIRGYIEHCHSCGLTKAW